MKFVFNRVQSGFWGRTVLPKQIVIKASDETEARLKVALRKDAFKKLRNGDSLSWTLVDKEMA